VEIWLKGIGAVVVIASLVITYLEYRWKRIADKIASEKEYQLRLYEARKPLYGDACRIAANLATGESFDTKGQSLQRFYELYYGELCLVEDTTLEQAMIAYRSQLLADLEQGKPSPALRRSALEVAKACQNTLNLETVFGGKYGGARDKLEGESSESRPLHPKYVAGQAKITAK
jgi:hypothetical protein